MKLKNNRGITLIELIISIALISIVILFLFRLLVDVRYSDNHSDFDRANQRTRAIIIKTIQQDFLERKLIGLTDQNTSLGSDQLVIDFSYGDGTNGTLRVSTDSNSNEQYLSYRNANGTEKWWLEKENSSTKYNTNCVSYTTSLSNPALVSQGEFFYMKFTIPVVVSSLQENYIDDLEFFYIGELKDISPSAFPDRYYLGNYAGEQCGKTS